MSAHTPPLFGLEQEAFTSDDYYTPRWLFEQMAIRFDIDVCAPPGGIPWIPADRYFTKADDALSQDWAGRVWMNPPFSEPEAFVRKFIVHSDGICLVPCSNGRWFHRLWASADAITLPADTAMKFVNGTGGGIPIRIVLAAFGDECVEAIARLGVVRRIA